MKLSSPKKLFVILGVALFLLLFVIGILILTGRHSEPQNIFSVNRLRTCHLENPIGIDEESPVFSWQMKSDIPGISQSAYQITLADSKDNLEKGVFFWDSGKTVSSLSAAIPYEGEPLHEKTRYFWQVTVWNQDDIPVVSTDTAFFETGLMGSGMGEAKWISAPCTDESRNNTDSDYIYTIHYDMEIANTSASFVFGAEKGSYGDMYLCRINHYDETASFELLQASGGSFAKADDSENVVDISALKKENTDVFTVELQIDHENLSVLVNETRIGDFSIVCTPLAAVGCYKSRGTSYAYLDNLLIRDDGGNVLFQDDFESRETIFSPYYVSLEQGKLKVGSGLILTKHYEEPAPVFYREFSPADKEIESARIYMTALGSFQLTCNGQLVSDDYFAPGKLVYNQELTYMTYDITSLLNRGESNTLFITLLHGWYDRAVGYPEIFNPWGDKNALLGMLEIHYQDGTTETISTDESFLCYTDGPVRMDDIYQGEFYDALKELPAESVSDTLQKSSLPAETNNIDESYFHLPLRGKENEPIRCIETLTPVSVTEPSPNVFVYDFGQNFAGTCRIKVSGSSGRVITLRYGEALNHENLDNSDDIPGTIFTENLLTAKATDYYVMKGDPEGESFEPSFTYHGFRYLQITGLDEALPIEDVQGIVLSSDLEATGSFECSNKLLNQYYQSTLWSQKSNFMDNPTDCCQRDERHGWAGDAQIFSLTASYHMDTYNFYRKYLHELMLLQTEGGSFPDMAPRNFGTDRDGKDGGGTNNCWGDAAMVITWNLYTQYGDKRIIEENYDSLCKWMEVLISTSDNYIRNWGGYGDHLSLEDTPSDVSDTAWCAHSADLLSKMASVLGKEHDAAYYRETFECFKEAWQTSYVQEDGTTLCDTQTSYALGLAFDLFPEELKEDAAGRLDTLAMYSNYHIHTGFSGIGYLLPSLCKYGLSETAYSFLLQEEYPSLLYPTAHGATTTYEQLSGYTENEDGTCHLDGSLNHYAFGTPAGWLYSNVLGIKGDENDPGYHHILIEPALGSSLTYAKGSYESAYGKIDVAWTKTKSGYTVSVGIPANTTATLTLPDFAEGKKVYELASGSHGFTVE